MKLTSFIAAALFGVAFALAVRLFVLPVAPEARSHILSHSEAEVKAFQEIAAEISFTGSLDQESRDILDELSQSENWQVRMLSGFSLFNITDPDTKEYAIEVLQTLATDDHPMVKSEANLNLMSLTEPSQASKETEIID